MGQPFIGEIRMFAGNFAPAGWRLCDGSLLPIAENDALFVLIGTTYGGDGENTFALPDLRGRVPMHMGSGHSIGETGGQETATLTLNQIPAHQHPFASSATATLGSPVGNVVAATTTAIYDGSPSTVPMAQNVAAGGTAPHDNMAPFVAINFIIALFGIFPPSS